MIRPSRRRPLSKLLAAAILIFPAVLLPRSHRATVDARPVDSRLSRRASRDLSIAGAAAIDTTWFGGTTWDPVDMRWEALRNSTWTFGTGVGSSINTDPAVKAVGLHRTMEGWTGYDRTDPGASLRFLRRTGLCALDGSYSLHAGATEAEADSSCWVSGQGYGDNMALQASKSFAYPGSGTVTLEYAYATEIESGYDFAYVLVDTSGDGSAEPVLLRTYTGTHSGSESIPLSPGSTLPTGSGSFRVLFQFFSDGAYSDEDGINPTTCGHSTIDDISLSGAAVDLSTFESGDDGWVVGAPKQQPGGGTVSVGDWSDLLAVGDLPDPGAGCACDFADSVLIVFDPSVGNDGGHPLDQDNIVLSPWIDLGAEGVTPQGDLLLEFAGHFDLPLINNVVVRYAVQWSPLECSQGGGPVSGIVVYGDVDYSAPAGIFPVCACGSNRVRRLLSDVVPAEATAIRVGIGIFSGCRTNTFSPCSGITNTTPWIDDVRVGVLSTGSVTGVGDVVDRTRAVFDPPQPNPATGLRGVSLRFFTPVGGRARIDVYDVAGRRVRTVLDDVVGTGWTERVWNARDAGDRPVAPGLYVVRFSAAGERVTRKVVVRP
jgi:hypothetical protein